ncbi:MAG: hypothetical protein R2856_18780 [Caldilineaceae bacterium]
MLSVVGVLVVIGALVATMATSTASATLVSATLRQADSPYHRRIQHGQVAP